jgi:hypothetical protein
VGTYAIAVAAGTLAAPNYTFVFNSGTLTIAPALLTVTPINYTRVYGQALPSPYGYGISGFVNGDTQSTAVTGTPGITCTAKQGSPVGTYPIAVTAGTLAAANYTFAFTGGTLTINRAVLTVTAYSYSRVEGTPLPNPYQYSISGFVNGDTQATAVTGAPVVTSIATPTSLPGTYPIVPAAGTLAAAEYTFTFVDGTLTITAN